MIPYNNAQWLANKKASHADNLAKIDADMRRDERAAVLMLFGAGVCYAIAWFLLACWIIL